MSAAPFLIAALLLPAQTVRSGELAALEPQTVGPFQALGDYGYEVALDGDRLLVGAPREKLAGNITGQVYAYGRDADGDWFLDAVVSIPAAATDTGGRLGWDLDLEGTRALVGAPELGDAGFASGGAFVFERDPQGEWPMIAKLTVPQAGENDRFGASVALDGDRALVASTRLGLFVFERQPDGTWPLVATIDPPGVFVSSCTLSGDVAVAAARPELQGGYRPFAYERQPDGTWLATADIPLPPGSTYGWFGLQVELDGDRLATGWADNSLNGFKAGLVTVHERQPDGTFSLVALLSQPDPQPIDRLGYDLEIDGDRVAATAWNGDGAVPDSGVVHVFERQPDGSWPPVAVLFRADGDPNGDFGEGLALHGDDVAVGSPRDGTPSPVLKRGLVDLFTLEPLRALQAEVSLAAGGEQALRLQAGPPYAGALYLLAGSASGSAPGLDVGAPLPLPLVPDAYLTASLAGANQAPFLATFGALDADGEAFPRIAVPAGADPALAGLVLHHAAVVLDPTTGALLSLSDAEPLALTP